MVSVTPEYYVIADWLRPVYRYQDVLIEFTGMMVACDSAQFTKQLETRVSTMPGVFDMVFNAVGSFLKWWLNTNLTGNYPDSYYTNETDAQLRAPLMDSVWDII